MITARMLAEELLKFPNAVVLAEGTNGEVTVPFADIDRKVRVDYLTKDDKGQYMQSDGSSDETEIFCCILKLK